MQKRRLTLLKPYSHKKNISYINGNTNNIYRDKNIISCKYFNSTFNNFTKNINKNNDNINSKNNININYNSNKTFINKSLNIFIINVLSKL